MRDKLAAAEGDYPRPPGVDPEALLTVVRIPREWARWRIDRVVVATFPRMSRTRAQGVIRIGAFSPDGRKLRSGARVRFDDVVLLYRPPFEEADVPLECPVLYEDERLLAIDKPPGLPVHPTARWHHHTVVKVLEKARPDQKLALCHRIDRETSGVLLLAKDRDAERFIKRALEARGIVEKRYLALTVGLPPWEEARITHAMRLDEHHRLRVKMRIADPAEEGALDAATRFRVVRRHPSGRYGWVTCDLETGRQHQIRVHLAAEGAPLVGDKLYGPDDELFARGADGTLTPEDLERLEHPRHALHAERLILPHPSDPTTRITITAPPPKDLLEFWGT